MPSTLVVAKDGPFYLQTGSGVVYTFDRYNDTTFVGGGYGTYQDSRSFGMTMWELRIGAEYLGKMHRTYVVIGLDATAIEGEVFPHLGLGHSIAFCPLNRQLIADLFLYVDRWKASGRHEAPHVWETETAYHFDWKMGLNLELPHRFSIGPFARYTNDEYTSGYAGYPSVKLKERNRMVQVGVLLSYKIM